MSKLSPYRESRIGTCVLCHKGIYQKRALQKIQGGSKYMHLGGGDAHKSCYKKMKSQKR